jgi:DnaJ family protein C protein 28
MNKQNRQQRKEQLRRTRRKIEERNLPVEPAHRPNRPRSEKERRNLVEQRIQEAMAEGAFDNLPGKGKPLNLNKNPFMESGQALAFGLLQKNGFAPEWIERDKEIRRDLADARRELRAAWRKHCQDRSQTGEAAWQTAIRHFEEKLLKLNRNIDNFNLIVPAVRGQRARLGLATELARLHKETE